MQPDSHPTKSDDLEPEPSSARALPEMNWLLFWGVLLAPMMGVMLLAVAGQADKAITGYVAFGGSGLAAIVCGYLLANRIASSPATRVLLTILLPVGFYILSVSLCFAGCAIAATVR